MAELDLPIMAPAGSGGMNRVLGLGCWARADRPPPTFDHLPTSPYWGACGDEPASDLGLCAHHLATIFPPEVRHAPRRP